MPIIAREIPVFDKDRILSNIDIDSVTECWNWKLSKDRDGYGFLTINSKSYRAHRASYRVFVDQPDPYLVMDHICRNRSCVNPEHLRQVTTKINVTQNSLSIQASNASKTHCINGHEFTEVNIITPKDNSRQYRICVNARQRAFNSTEERRIKKTDI